MKVLVVLFVAFVIGAQSIILEPEQRLRLREIRNVCIIESGLSPYEIGLAIRAIRPARKLANASRCIVEKLVELREEDEIVGQIVDRTKAHISNLPVPVNNVVTACENLLGPKICGDVLQLIAQIAQNAQNAQQNVNPLLRSA